ncbi:transposase, partial [Lentimicrobium sp. L6]
VNGKWHTILSTNTNLSFIEIIEIYSIRWTIEVFFKEVKQLFKLGTCQSTNFDVQIAQTTIIMIQYLLTSIRFRMEAYETIGGLFRDLKQDYIEHKLNDRILLIVYQIMDFLEKVIDGVDFQKIAHELINNSENFLFFREKEPILIQLDKAV